MTSDQKDRERIDRIARKHRDGILERLKRIDEQFDANDARTLRRIDVLEDMLDIMNEH